MSEDAIFFPSPEAFRAWLADHHGKRSHLLVGYYKKATGKPTLTWDESVDEALCYGWIDGVRRGIDAERYTIRFTPRRVRSHWSTKNIASVQRLIAEGRMMPPGLSAFEARDAGKSAPYSFERDDDAPFAAALRERFEAHPEAWESFNRQPPGYRKTLRHWVMSAKREETRVRRLDRLIDVSGRGRRVDLGSPFSKES